MFSVPRSALSLVVFLLSFSTCALAASTSTSVNITLPSSYPTYNVVQDNFAGISLEFNVLDHLIGSTPNSIPPPIINYLKNIRSRISNPLRLRVGGNSLDGSFYNPAAGSMIDFNIPNTTIAAGVANVPVTFGPQVLTTLAKLAEDVGGISHLIGLSLVYPNNDTNVVQFAQAAQKTLGSSLDAALVGNEPDLYEENHKRPANYTVYNYAQDLQKVVGDLQTGNVDMLLGQPSLCCSHPNWDLSDVLKATLSSPVNSQFKYSTLQHYPQQSCNDFGSNRWDISYFTNHTNVQALMWWQGDGVLMAREAGKQVIMDEFNSASCGGEAGRSDTFAAAIWTIDYELGLAANNYTAAYLHTREPGITYDIFTYPNVTGVATSGWTTGPQYYSLLLLADAFSTLPPGFTKKKSAVNGSVVVDLNLANPLSAAGYALYDAGTPTASSLPRTLVLMNFANGTSPNSTSTTFHLPASISSVRVRILTAPSLNDNASSLISYAGQTMDAAGTGALSGKMSEKVHECASGVGCAVEVPGPGVAVVFVDGKDNALKTKTSSGMRRPRNPEVILNHTYGLIIGMILGILMAMWAGLV